MTLQTSWSILLIFSTGLMIYYNVSSPWILKPESIEIVKRLKSTTTVRKIIAYSLNKQIELEGEEVICENSFGQFNSTTTNSVIQFWDKVDGTELYVTSVTLDERLQPYRYLRIIGMVKGNQNDTLFCQILMSDGHVRIVKSTVTPIWYEKWDENDNNTYYNPMLVSCRLPTAEDHLTPMAMSLTVNPCNLSRTLQTVRMPVEMKQINFTVCVKPLNFKQDISHYLVQWIEMCKILGAQHFHIFVKNVTKRTKQLLKWYKHKFPETLHLEDFNSIESNCTTNNLLKNTWQRRRYEVVTYNKCFYRNLNSKFIIPLDIDEVIVPKTSSHWENVVNHLTYNYSSLIVQNVYFFTKSKNNTNKTAAIFFNVNRRQVPSNKGENSKSFISTRNTLTVFNHYALHALRPDVIKDYFLPLRDVQLNHYKESCNSVIFPECSQYLDGPTVVDSVMFRYKKQFFKKYKYVLARLKKDKIKF